MKIAILFPGQGSQYVGMGADLVSSFDEARRQAEWLKVDREKLRRNEP